MVRGHVLPQCELNRLEDAEGLPQYELNRLEDFGEACSATARTQSPGERQEPTTPMIS